LLCRLNRQLQFQELSVDGHEDLVQTLMFDGVTSPEVAAVQILKADKKARAGELQDVEDDGNVIQIQSSAGDEEVDNSIVDTSNLPIEEQCKAKWDADPDLRAEFMDDYESWQAYAIAEDNGQVKMYKDDAAAKADALGGQA